MSSGTLCSAAVDALCVLVKHARPNELSLSDLSRCRETFSLAWLILLLLKNNEEKLSFPFIQLDLSRCCLPPGKVFLLLRLLPRSVEDLTFGRSALEGASLPLLCRFLSGLENRHFILDSSSSSGGEGRRSSGLKGLTFAEDSVGSEAAELFAALPSSLETLNLKGNYLSEERAFPLAQTLKTRRLPHLRSLILDNTGLDGECLEMLCSALAEASREAPLRIETLSLAFLSLTSCVCSVLNKDVLPSLQHLCLNGARLDPQLQTQFPDTIRKGDLSSLRSLDLTQVIFRQKGATAMGSVLQATHLPHLKTLHLADRSGPDQPSYPFQDSLVSPKLPALENVHLSLDCVTPHLAHALLSGQLRFLRGLSVWRQENLSDCPFFEGLAQAESPVLDHIETLNLTLLYADSTSEKHLGQALNKGLLNACLHSLIVIGSETSGVLSSLSSGSFPFLTILRFEGTDQAASALSEGLQGLSACISRGHLPVLRELVLHDNGLLGGPGMKLLMGAVCECPEGLPCLQILDLGSTKAGESMDSLAAAVRRRKLPKLQTLHMQNSNMDDEGLLELGMALRVNFFPSLTCLDLRGNKLTDEGLDAFVESLSRQSLPNLSRLLVEGPSVSRKKWEAAVTWSQVQGKLRAFHRKALGCGPCGSNLW